MGRVEGKVALITAAARGQGRAHALRLAEEGADIIALDLCAPVNSTGYPPATPEDLAETAKLVESLDRRIVARGGMFHDLARLQSVVSEGVAELGHIDIVVANAGIVTYQQLWDITEEEWQEVIDINLTGAWKTVKAALPPMIEAGRGGSVIFTSSLAGLKGIAGLGHYASTKHGLVGLMRTLANEAGRYGIRANSVHPGGVNTAMSSDNHLHSFIAAQTEDGARSLAGPNPLPLPTAEPREISEAVLWLASDESRYVTGAVLPIDAGGSIK